MSATETLRDIWAHHAWADAEHWRAFEAFPMALQDGDVFARLHEEGFLIGQRLILCAQRGAGDEEPESDQYR